MSDCIFCLIVKGEAPSYKVWEDESHLAFLSIFPNTQGVTVVVPKKHVTSYIFDQSDKVISDLMIKSKKVAKLLEGKLEDVGRVAVVFEGYGVDHLHAKLFPMHGTKNMKDWKPIESNVDKYFDQYEGYISSHNFKKEDDEKLAKLAALLRS